MKKNIIYLLILISALGLSACVPARVEKEPVVVNDSQDKDATTNAPSPTVSGENKTKTSTVSIEGEQVNTVYFSYKSPLGYEMSYDFDKFKHKNKDEIDSYTVENPDPNVYPYIYLNISRTKILSDTDSSKKSELSKILDPKGDLTGYISNNNDKLKPGNTENTLGYIQYSAKDTAPIESVKLGDYKALHYTLTHGSKWNSPVSEFYYITKGDYVYCCEMHYYLEATEGYAARMKAMLDTIRIE